MGVWKPQSVKTSPPPEVRYALTGTGGVKVSQDGGVNFTFQLDNVPVMIQGPTVISGSMVAFREVDDHTLESTSTREGVVTGKSTMSVPNDGKTMTTTSTSIGPNGNSEPTVRVFEKR